MKSGVPQGSILGPLLFLIYVNDLPEVVKHVIFYMFADDVKCAMPIRSPLDSLYLQEDLEALCDWSAKWKLKFKESKCVLLRCFTNNNSTPTPTVYTLNGKEIQASNFHKDLGIVISDNLSFRCHYELLIARAYQILGLLRRTFNHRPCVKEKMALYISLVRSQLMYCSQVWRPYLLWDIDKIERVQRRATKYILNDFTSDYKSRLITLGILPLMYVFELNDLMLCVKNLKSPSRDFDIKKYVKFSDHGTRSATSSRMIHRFTSTNSSRHEFFTRIPRLWNSVPSIDLKLSQTTIKHNLQDFLYKNFLAKFEPSNACSFHFLCPCMNCFHTSHPPILFNSPNGCNADHQFIHFP